MLDRQGLAESAADAYRKALALDPELGSARFNLATFLARTSEFAEAETLLCDAEPIITDGSKLAYHAITGGFVLGRVLREVTGEDINAYLDRKIRRPMQMRYFTYGVRPEHRAALAHDYATGPHQGPVLNALIRRALGTDMRQIEAISSDPRFHEAVIPAGNLVGTAEEVSAFFQMMLGDEPFGLWGPHSRRALGHVGLINKFAWADPERQLSAAILTSGMLLVAHHLVPFGRVIRGIASLAPRGVQVQACAPRGAHHA